MKGCLQTWGPTWEPCPRPTTRPCTDRMTLLSSMGRRCITTSKIALFVNSLVVVTRTSFSLALLIYCAILNIHYTHVSKDVPLGDVKLKQLGDWVGRRNKSPSAVAGAMSRYIGIPRQYGVVYCSSRSVVMHDFSWDMWSINTNRSFTDFR